MVPRLLKDWSEFDRLEFDPSGAWFRRYLDQLDTFVRKAAGKSGISHFILIDGLNFVFELVGATETFLSLVERPDIVRRAIEFAFELNITIQNAFFDRTETLHGGTCSNMVQWMPGRIVSESIDPFRDRLSKRRLPGGVLYDVSGVPDLDTANRLMDEVRAYRV